MNVLNIPLEYWDFNSAQFTLACPHNMLYPIDNGSLNTHFQLKMMLLPCSTPYAKRDAVGRTFTWKAIKENIYVGALLVDGIGNVERVTEVRVDGYSSYPVSLPPGYRFNSLYKMIVNTKAKNAIFFVLVNGIWKKTYRRLTSHPLYKPPEEIPKVGCVKSSKRVYKALTDRVKVEHTEKDLIILEDVRKKLLDNFDKKVLKEAKKMLSKRSLWRRFIDFLKAILKRS